MDWHFVVAIALFTSLITVVGSFYTLASVDFKRLRAVVLVSIGIGLGILLPYCFDFYAEDYFRQNTLSRVRDETSKESLQFGPWGAILGYIVAAVGMFLINRKDTNKRVEGSAELGNI